VVVSLQHDGVASLWLRRPSHANALDPETVQRLHRELSFAEEKPECFAVVIRAEGSSFCAGADVLASKALMEKPESLLSFFDEGRRLMERLLTSRLVSIAVVHGLAAAGGLELVAATDLVIAAGNAKFVDRHARYGFLPAFGATALLPIRVNRRVATTMLLGGRVFDASTALAVGLVHRVCRLEEIEEVVNEETTRLGRCAVGALSDMKVLVNRMAPVTFEPERIAVRSFNHEHGYDPSRFISRAEQARGQAK
jgi:enoyl-CoA hydratase/carnithine racemase